MESFARNFGGASGLSSQSMKGFQGGTSGEYLRTFLPEAPPYSTMLKQIKKHGLGRGPV